MTIVISGGDNAGRMNLLLLAEGYTLADRPLFDQHVEQLAKAIRSESWYRQGLLNVHALWVESRERAPTAPSGKPNDTAFRAYYGGDRAAHVISGDDDAVRVLMVRQPPFLGTSAPMHAIVLTNSTLYGGRGGGQGGGMCWTYTDARNPARWTSCALHELGHALFGLADEYGGDGFYGGSTEPKEPNVTLDKRGAKWRHLIVGAVAGGKGYDSGIYHPTHTCRMRIFPAPFCAVCSDAARRTLDGFLSEREPDAEPVFSVSVLGPSGSLPPITRSFPDDSAGCMEAVQFLLKRQFG